MFIVAAIRQPVYHNLISIATTKEKDTLKEAIEEVSIVELVARQHHYQQTYQQ